MQLDISKFSYDSKRFTHKTTDGEECHLDIRPFPASMGSVEFGPKGTFVSTGSDRFDRFMYCLTGWDVQDAEGKVIPLTDEVKKTVFDFGAEGIPGFVLTKVAEMDGIKAELEKN